jgi:cytochrome c-type biogenesis protein CcmH
LAVAQHRTQLQERDRDLAEGRILPAEHRTAVLEVQRRLLAAAAADEPRARPGASWPILAVVLIIPSAAFGLYWVSGGQPYMPSVDTQARRAQVAEEAALIDELRRRLAVMDPDTDRTRQGYVLLGSVEEERGNAAAAADAFRMALHGKFDPTIAARAAEAATRAEGGVSEASADLFRRAIAAAPDAPWREAVLRRLQEPRIR